MTNTHNYTVSGMSCDHCKRTIEEGIAAVEGVEAVDVDLESKAVVITGGDPAAIEQAIVAAGYAVA